MSPPRFRHRDSLRKRFSSIEPRSPSSPQSPNGHQIYTVPDHDDDVFEDDKNLPKSPKEPTIIPPPPTPGTAHSPPQKSKKKLRIRDVILIIVGIALLLALVIGTALAIILVNTKGSTSSATSTVSPVEEIHYKGYLSLSSPWKKTEEELENRFLTDMETIIKSSRLHKAFIKPSLLNKSTNGTLHFKLDFKRGTLEEVSQTSEVTDISLGKTVQNILREQVVKYAGIIVLPIVADSIVILAEDIPVTLSTTVSTASSAPPTTTETKGQCLSMTHERCHSLLGNSTFHLPNMLHHTTQEQAEDAFAELSGPNVNLECSVHALSFLCSVLFPSCDEGTKNPIYPCDTFCKVVQDDCNTIHGWPLNCNEFPTVNCVPPEERPSTTLSTVPSSITSLTSEITTTATTGASTTTPTTTRTTPTTTTTTTTTTASTTTPTITSTASTTTIPTTSTSISTSTSVSTTASSEFQCVKLDLPICNELGLHDVRLPDFLFLCSDLDCLKDQFYFFANASIMSGCTTDFTFFCGFIFSSCDIPMPCKETCDDAVNLCSEYLPYPPDCSYYPPVNNGSGEPCIASHPGSTTAATVTPLPDKCIEQTFQYCSSEGFTKTNEKTWFGNNLQETIHQFEIWALPTIELGCSALARFFYCGIFFPKCEENKDVALPCRKYCEEVSIQCPNATFPMDCTVLNDGEMCVNPTSIISSSSTWATTTTQLTTSSVTTPSSRCVDLPSPICSQFGYSKTIFPNLWADSSAEEANRTYYRLAEAAVSNGCSPNVLFYVCSVLFPYCEGEGVIKLPCTTYCEEVSRECSTTLFKQDCQTLADSNHSTCLSPPEKIACQATSFACVQINKCVPQNALCNKINDCGDWSDERDCECHSDFEVQCDMGLCLPSYHRCDGLPQCPDNSDENGCDPECKMNQYRCQDNGPCIMNEWLCDGYGDCPRHDDEMYCHNCEVNEFMCVDQTCIPFSQRCDGFPQCSDHSDETNCISTGFKSGPMAPLFLDMGSIYTYACSDGFTDVHGQTSCVKLGEDSLRNWTAKPAPRYYMFFQLDPNGENFTVLGRGNAVQTCPSNHIAAIDCAPKVCGHPSPPLPSLIINGRNAEPASWPWMISLRKFGVHECGGAIIHPYFVLTAAHCVYSYTEYSRVLIVAGTTRLSKLGAYGQRRFVRRAIIYPGYKFFRGDDIALIELKTPFEYNDFVKPLCLPEEGDVFTRANECYLAGWGHMKGVGGVPSEHQQEAKMSLWETGKCNSSYMWNGRLLLNEMCAGYFNGLTAACSGDSGSPVMCKDITNTWKVVGVASYVYKTCSVPTKPMVFTQIQPYREWINNHTVCQFTCDNGICLFDKGMLCDTVDDCGDRSDEINTCDIRANCTFYDKFLCGYLSKWHLVTKAGTNWVNHFPLFDHTLGKYPGKYLMGIKRGVDIKTPRIDLTTPHCFRFHYHMRGEVDQGMAVSVHELEGRQWTEAWEIGKVYGPDKWLMGMFDLGPGHYDIVFRPHNHRRFALDDMWLLNGTCQALKCLEGEFMCNTFGIKNCLPMMVKCNTVKDCDEGEDEKGCTDREYICDFENGNICGLEQHSDDSRMGEWQLVNSTDSPNNLKDHTYKNDSGMLLMIETQSLLPEDQVLMSQKLWLDGSQQCLKFHYASTAPATLLVTLEWGSTLQTLVKFTDRITSEWILTQAGLPVVPKNETATLTYSVIGGELGVGTFLKAIMLDDITITVGQCPTFNCPLGTLLCEGEAYCLQESKVCDRVIDCNQGTDEINCVCNATEFKCPTGSCIPVDKTCDTIKHCPDGSDEGAICDNQRSISCDFEHPFLCGYSVNTSSAVYHWHRGSGKTGDTTTGPASDHTYENGELLGFYVVADSQYEGDYTALSSLPFISFGNGLVFYYHARHFLHKVRMTGRLSLLVTELDTGLQTELWYGMPDTDDHWKFQCISLPRGNISLSFVAQKGSGFSADIAIDDVKQIPTSCDLFLTDGRLGRSSSSGDTTMPTSGTSSDCKETQRKCRNEMCLDVSNFCDGVWDCPDGYDEVGCNP